MSGSEKRDSEKTALVQATATEVLNNSNCLQSDPRRPWAAQPQASSGALLLGAAGLPPDASEAGEGDQPTASNALRDLLQHTRLTSAMLLPTLSGSGRAAYGSGAGTPSAGAPSGAVDPSATPRLGGAPSNPPGERTACQNAEDLGAPCGSEGDRTAGDPDGGASSDLDRAGPSGSGGGDIEGVQRLVAACWEAMERYAPLQLAPEGLPPPPPPPAAPGQLQAEAAAAEAGGAEGEEAADEEDPEDEEDEAEGLQQRDQQGEGLPLAPEDWAAVGWRYLADSEWEFRALISQAAEDADGTDDGLGQEGGAVEVVDPREPAPAEEAPQEGQAEAGERGGGAGAGGLSLQQALRLNWAAGIETLLDGGARAGSQDPDADAHAANAAASTAGAGCEGAGAGSAAAFGAALPGILAGAGGSGGSSGALGATGGIPFFLPEASRDGDTTVTPMDADEAGAGGAGGAAGRPLLGKRPPPSPSLEAHLAAVSAGLIRRHCTVPLSDPLVTEYAAKKWDALQL